jgi:hypothetical protein
MEVLTGFLVAEVVVPGSSRRRPHPAPSGPYERRIGGATSLTICLVSWAEVPFRRYRKRFHARTMRGGNAVVSSLLRLRLHRMLSAGVDAVERSANTSCVLGRDGGTRAAGAVIVWWTPR